MARRTGNTSPTPTPKRPTLRRTEIRRGDMVVVHPTNAAMDRWKTALAYSSYGCVEPRPYYARVLTSFLTAGGACTVIVETPSDPCTVVCLGQLGLAQAVPVDAP